MSASVTRGVARRRAGRPLRALQPRPPRHSLFVDVRGGELSVDQVKDLIERLYVRSRLRARVPAGTLCTPCTTPSPPRPWRSVLTWSSCRPCWAMPPWTPPGVTSTHRRGTPGGGAGHLARWRCGTIPAGRSPDLHWAGEIGQQVRQSPPERGMPRTYPPTRPLREPLRRLWAERLVRSAPVGERPLTCVDPDRPRFLLAIPSLSQPFPELVGGSCEPVLPERLVAATVELHQRDVS